MAASEIPLADDRDLPVNLTFAIQRNEKYTIKWWKDNHDKDPKQARRIIRHLLKNLNYTINTKPIRSEAIQSVAKDSEAGELAGEKSVSSDAKLTGIAHALCNCYSDNSQERFNIGQVKAGQPVVFDTVSGYALTGINPDWMPDEYQIFGTALQSGHNRVGLQRLPILLHKQHHAYPQIYPARLLEACYPGQSTKARLLVHIGKFEDLSELPEEERGGWTVNYRAPDNPEDESEVGYDVQVWSLGQGLFELSDDPLIPPPPIYNFFAGNKREACAIYPPNKDVFIFYEYNSGRWVIFADKFYRQTIRGVLIDDLEANGHAQMQHLRLNEENVWTLVDEYSTVFDFHMPPQGRTEEGVRITAHWDWDAGVYVVGSASPTNAYGTFFSTSPFEIP